MVAPAEPYRIEVEGAELPTHPGLYGAGEARCHSEPARGRLASCYAFAALGVVVSGRFDYRSPIGRAQARPGTVLLGNAAEDFDYGYLDTAGVRRAVVALDGGLLAEVANDCGRDAAAFSVAGLEPGRAGVALYAAIRRLAANVRPCEEAVIRVTAAALGVRRAPAVETCERRRVRDVAARLDAACAEDLSLGEMAALAGLSRYHFIRAFRTVTGETPRQYLIGARLRAAADRLADTREPVTEIALSVGFNDLSHFNATFRRAFGMAPRVWRRAA
jgi:AraC-like DNA-binding protein